jgi:Putative auto-transporter adhesin, head GIN domain
VWNQASDTTGVGMLEGSGVPTSETRELPPFNRVELAASNQVTIRVGGEQSVVVHADDNLLDRVTTRVSGGKLSIGNEAGGYTTRNPIRVDVVVPAVHELTLSGSGTIDADGVDVDEFTIALSGSGAVSASGRALHVDVKLNGSGDVQLQDLLARDVRATMSGTGRIAVHATESLDASVPGTGSIVYTGNPPQVRKSVDGIGSVTSR